MNLFELAPFWLVGVLCALLLVAATEDALRLKISNLTVLAVVVAAVAAASVVGPMLALWQNLLVFALLLAGGTLLFASGKVGGGDVKLLAAVGLWTDLERSLILIAGVFIAGGLLALIVLLPRFFRRRPKGASRTSGKSVPYAVAIAVGALIVIALERQPPDRQRPNPLEFPAESI